MTTSKAFLKAISISILLVTSASCHKKTSSTFKLNKHQYAAGEYLDFINLSAKTRKQIWTLTDETGEVIDTKSEPNPDFKLKIMLADGKYFLNLADNEKELEKGVTCTKEFNVTTIKGKLVIKANEFMYYDVSIDDEPMGNFNGYEIKFDLPVGKRKITLTSTFNSITETKYAEIDETQSEYLYF